MKSASSAERLVNDMKKFLIFFLVFCGLGANSVAGEREAKASLVKQLATTTTRISLESFSEDRGRLMLEAVKKRLLTITNQEEKSGCYSPMVADLKRRLIEKTLTKNGVTNLCPSEAMIASLEDALNERFSLDELQALNKFTGTQGKAKMSEKGKQLLEASFTTFNDFCFRQRVFPAMLDVDNLEAFAQQTLSVEDSNMALDDLQKLNNSDTKRCLSQALKNTKFEE